MKDEHVLKKLLVCAPEYGKRSAQGQHLRWTDVVTRDLTRGLYQCCREKAFTAELMEEEHCSVDRKAQCRRGQVERQVQFCGHSRL